MKKKSNLELIEKRISELTIYIAKRQAEYRRLVKERERIQNEKRMKKYTKAKFLEPLHATMAFMQFCYNNVNYEDFNKISTGEMPLHLWEVDYWIGEGEDEVPCFSVYIGELEKIVNNDGSIYYDNHYVSGVPWETIKEMF